MTYGTSLRKMSVPVAVTALELSSDDFGLMVAILQRNSCVGLYFSRFSISALPCSNEKLIGTSVFPWLFNSLLNQCNSVSLSYFTIVPKEEKKIKIFLDAVLSGLFIFISHSGF